MCLRIKYSPLRSDSCPASNAGWPAPIGQPRDVKFSRSVKERMKRRRYREAQINGILKLREAGVTTTDLCREHGIRDATFYNWKAKYRGSMSLRRSVRQMEDEKLVADLSREA
jgi:putative transposase